MKYQNQMMILPDAIAIALNHLNSIKGIGALVNNPRGINNRLTKFVKNNKNNE